MNKILAFFWGECHHEDGSVSHATGYPGEGFYHVKAWDSLEIYDHSHWSKEQRKALVNEKRTGGIYPNARFVLCNRDGSEVEEL